MEFDAVQDVITGLEDDDNFFELVRQRGRLNSEDLKRFLDKLPQDTESFVYPKLVQQINASLIAAVGMAISERVPEENLRPIREALPNNLNKVMAA